MSIGFCPPAAHKKLPAAPPRGEEGHFLYFLKIPSRKAKSFSSFSGVA
jgi:hypothetical protein